MADGHFIHLDVVAAEESGMGDGVDDFHDQSGTRNDHDDR
jgi:hypothetical protein